jgi:hypothetical protein
MKYSAFYSSAPPAQPTWFAIVVVAALTLLLCASGALQAKTPQAPVPPQAPACCDDVAGLCPCSLTGVCTCTAKNDECGCVSAGKYRWVETSNPNQVALYQGELQWGNYWRAEKEYRRLTETSRGDVWTACDCPAALHKSTTPASTTHAPMPTAPRPATVQFVRPQQFALPSQSWSQGGGFSGGGGACRGGG